MRFMESEVAAGSSGCLQGVGRRYRTTALNGKKRSRVVELASASFGTRIELARIDYDPALDIQFHSGAVHWPRRRSFKIDPLAVITATVARAFELVFARFPVGCAAKVSAPGVNHEQSRRGSYDPDAILLLELRVHPQSEIRDRAHGELSLGFKESSREKKPQEHQEVGSQKCRDARPDETPTLPDPLTLRGWHLTLGGANCFRRGFRGGSARWGYSFAQDGLIIPRAGFRYRHVHSGSLIVSKLCGHALPAQLTSQICTPMAGVRSANPHEQPRGSQQAFL